MNENDMFSPDKAGVFLNQSPNTLAGQRSRGEGPIFTKIGGRVFYLRSDLEAYVRSRRFTSTAQARAAKPHKEVAGC